MPIAHGYKAMRIDPELCQFGFQSASLLFGEAPDR